MQRSLFWKGLFIVAAIALALAAMLPLGRKLALGLDLRGGTYLALRVETEDALRHHSDPK